MSKLIRVLPESLESHRRDSGATWVPGYTPVVLTLLCFSSVVAGADESHESGHWVDPYDVAWGSPSRDSSGSMPLGNGDIGLNVWVEPSGDLVFYISKTDAWSGNGRLLKVGRVRASFEPSVFADDSRFSQTLHLGHGEIVIRTGQPDASSRMRVWVDANAPIIHIECSTARAVNVTATAEIWRDRNRLLEGKEVDSAYGLQGGPDPVVVHPDETHDVGERAVAWCHHNQSSIWPLTMRLQGLVELFGQYDDPLLGRTFGAMMTGTGMRRIEPTAIQSDKPQREHRIDIAVATVQAEPAKLLRALERISKRNASTPIDASREAHRRWWRSFWDRHWIRVSGSDEAFTVSKGYALQRFISACAGRGAYPIKFNGSIFTVDAREDKEQYDADYRRWGGPYWFQNTRLAYWPMIAAGDFDLMQPLFRMYRDLLPFAEDRTRIYFDHAGAFFPETQYFWGAYACNNYGWDRTGKPAHLTDNRYIRYYYSGGLELITMMLDVYEHTQDEVFLVYTALPLADAIVRFYDEHYPRDADGRIRFEPAQALETWQTAVNPAPVVAGLQFVLDRLIPISKGFLTDEQRDAWRRLREELPPMPMQHEDDLTWILPAQEFSDLRNQENAELYAVFPYRLYGVGRPDLAIGRTTFEKRQFKSNIGWSQDPIQAACLGLTDVARALVAEKFATHHAGSRFPAFWGPNYDWIPDQDHGGVAMIALQKMLLQTNGRELHLLPAWPRDWDVAFKLHAPHNTTIEGRFRGGRMERLDLSPPTRAADIINHTPR